MGRIKSVCLFVGMMLFPLLIFAQFNNNTTSPYSRFGLGDLHPKSVGRTASMGGASIASRNSFQINPANPASYTAVDSLNFLFEIGVKGKFVKFSNELNTMQANDVNFWYAAMNFQITNWLATSIGLQPYSDVGYDVRTGDSLAYTGIYDIHHYGVGSLSKAYIGFAVDPVKNISLGFNLSYLFGALSHNVEEFFLDAPDLYNSNKFERTRLHGFGIDLGIQATLPLKNDQRITFGATLENKPKYTAFKSNIVQKFLSTDTGTDIDTIKIQEEEKGKIQLPLNVGFGVSFVKENSLEINADYSFQKWTDATFFGIKNPDLTDSHKFAIGGEWIPNKFSIRNYVSRVAYRFGIQYENSYLMLNNQQINDFGINFGIGLPMYRSNSTFNIGVEFGKRGTTSNNLIKENYAILNFSVNLNDLWFIKNKFN